MDTSVRDRFRFAGQLVEHDPDARPMNKQRKREGLAEPVERLADLQERLFAESTTGGRRAVLLVLQGIDTAGKGGVTTHVFAACGPIGLRYTAFKRPTEEELQHDFLWRIRSQVPGPGVIGVFDRSHYEDVLVPHAHDTLDLAEIEQRYQQINEFEASLVAAGVSVLKCFLHISSERQRRRLLQRLDRPDKHWKFQESDLDERALWPKYQKAFDAMLQHTNAADAPWFVVPSNHKSYRNWVVAQLLLETLQAIDPQYPNPPLDIPALKARLT